MEIEESACTSIQDTKKHEVQSFRNINSLKILNDIKSMGCKNQALCAATYRTYLNLCEVRNYEAVEYFYMADLDILYIKAQKKIKNEDSESEEEIIIPILETTEISFKLIELYQRAFSSSSIQLAICDFNALIMYYKLSKTQ